MKLSMIPLYSSLSLLIVDASNNGRVVAKLGGGRNQSWNSLRCKLWRGICTNTVPWSVAYYNLNHSEAGQWGSPWCRMQWQGTVASSEAFPLDGVESTRKIKEQDSHSASLLLQVWEGPVHQEDEPWLLCIYFLNSFSRLWPLDGCYTATISINYYLSSGFEFCHTVLFDSYLKLSICM